MALTIAQKSNVRRHLKYQVAGLLTVSPAGGSLAQGQAGWRFHQAYGFLEYKMNNLNPDEEARLTGLAFAAIALIGPQPNEGDTISVTLSGGNIASPQTITVTAGAQLQNVDGRLTLCKQIAAAVSLNTVLQAAGVFSLTPYGTGAFSQNAVPLPEVAFNSPVTFSISASGSGALAPQITATGTLLTPSVSLDGINTIYGFLPILDGLENAYGSASQNLDTIRADVWYGRSNELGQRFSLYTMWQQRLSDFLGIPLNQDTKNNPKSTGAMQFS